MRCLDCDYQIDHLTDRRCPECGRAFDLNHPRTFAPDTIRSLRSFAIAASFAGTLLGWCVAQSLHIVRQVSSGFGYVTDQKFWLSYTTGTIVVWWTIGVVPALMLPGVLRLLRKHSVRATLWGILFGVVGYCVIIGWMAGFGWYMLTFAGVVGGFTGLATGIVLSSRRVLSAAPPRFLVSTLVLLPTVALLTWFLAVWPLICFVSPRVQHKFGDALVRGSAVHRVLSLVQVGDSYDKLHQLLPAEFQHVEGVGYSGSRSSSGSFSYDLVVKDGIIQELQLHDGNK